MQVMILGASEEPIALKVRAEDDVIGLKVMIQEKTGVPKEHQHPVHSTKPMQDRKRLLEYGVQKGDSKQMTSRGPGGAKKKNKESPNDQQRHTELPEEAEASEVEDAG